MLDFAKDAIERNLYKGVYAIPCSCGMRYVGETGRSIKARIKEHMADIKHGRTKQSVVVEQYHDTKHHVCLEDTKVLATIPHHYKRKIREALEIEKCRNNFNRDDGLKLKEAWKPVVHIFRNNHESSIRRST